ncbi:nicotinate-nucleotide--dimethylbenzimidazole phosphoribosyltransferase [Streptomyces sp. JB150]|uniref:nicotinate-nucleotide--dimethylbenzimidazole phosphoribosyltransferase n=1 Tax=Streptomyces sp. JB150 TaxID=2714844 RepID=UPI0014090A02|nr:nicotinate-nucleotide--dimethylbenzimidazole phosphoribosyltransferase [Streptomyces sp. JB150]QIJ61667.1 nicotinate-nucleotide--dimethylbenzimidazole phosphoribosyltransferase [Streptomyces sp. JB150]
MTDTGQVPGEGLPENAGTVEQPGVPAPGAYTYLSETPAEDEDLLLPGAQGAWGNEVPPPTPEPVVEAVHEPGPHELGGRDSGSVDLTGVRLPNPTVPTAPTTPIPPITPRRPLHLGPPIPDTSASPVRSLADRGPAGVPVRQPGQPAAGPEYLDVPREAVPQGAAPWSAQAAAPAPAAAPAQVVTEAMPAETVVPVAPQPHPEPEPEPTDAAQAAVARLTTQAASSMAGAQTGAQGEPEQVPGEETQAAEGAEAAVAPVAEAAQVPADGTVPADAAQVPAEVPVAADAGQDAAAAPVAGDGGDADGGDAAEVPAATPAADEAAQASPAVPAAAEAPAVAQAAPVEGPAQPQPAEPVQGPVAVPAPEPEPVQGPAAVPAPEPEAVQAPPVASQEIPAPEMPQAPTAPEQIAEAVAPESSKAAQAPEAPAPAADQSPQAPEAPAPAADQSPQAPQPAAAVAPEAAQAPEPVAAAEVPQAAAPVAQPVAPEAPHTPEATAPEMAQAAPDAVVAEAAAAEAPQAPEAAAAQAPQVPEAAAAGASGPAEAVEPVAPEAVPSPEPAAAEAVQAPQAPEPAAPEAPQAPEAVVPAPTPEAALTEPTADASPTSQPAEPADATAQPHPQPTEAAQPQPIADQQPAEQPVEQPAPPHAAAPEPTPDAQPQPEPEAHPHPETEPQPEAAVTDVQDTSEPTGPLAAPARTPASEAAAPADAAAPAPAPQATEPAAGQPVGRFVPVEGMVPSTPDLAPTPPQAAPAAEDAPHPDAAPQQQPEAAVTVPAPREAEPETVAAAGASAEADPDVALVQQADDLDTRGAGQEDRAHQEHPEAHEEEGTATVAEARQSTGPAAPAYDDAEREAVLKVMRERRDIRNGFRSDPIPHEVLLRVLEAAHHAPSVGHSQPWDFVVIRSADTRRAMHELAMRQREAYAKSLPKGRAKQFKELKIEAILDTPVNIVVTADPTRGGRHTLGRHTQPQMAPYSAALAVENLWLAARAEGLGVGWVSFFDEREMVRALGLPEHLEVIAYLCVGYVDEFPDEPELMQAGWSKRRPLSWVVHEETYGRRALPGEEPHDLLAETVAQIRPLDAKALGEAWERQKRMTKPAGALGMLEIISAQLSGLSRQCPPPIPEPAAVAIFAGDHGVHAQGVTPWPQEVTAQMVANFLGGGAVCNAFANQVGAEVCVVDVGVAADLPATPGLLPRKIRPGTADMTTGPAMTREEAKQAIEVGIETARDLVAAGNKALLTGEMGIANTTASAALISVFTGADPAEVTGRGTGINDETLARKTEVVRRTLEVHQPDPADPIGVLAAIGGLEHAAMVGLLLGGASLRTPVILDGVSAGAAALVARAIAPEVLAACIAGHRSAEPGHVAALNKLGLRPLIDLDLRLGEGTGALLALPMVQSTARAMHEVATFDSAGVTEK